MSRVTFLEFLDSVSPKHVLNGRMSSWIGAVASLGLITLVILIIYSPCLTYSKGDYYQSMYQTGTNFFHTFFSKDDFKLAAVFKNKINGNVYNHSYLLNHFQAVVNYYNQSAYYTEPLQTCDKGYFNGDINGVGFQDCLIIPNYVQYDAQYLSNKYAYLELWFGPPLATTPFPRNAFAQSFQQKKFTDFINNYYCEFYFTSKVITDDGTVKFHVHRAYSTQINIGSDTIGAKFKINAGMRVTLMDFSIMPWRNYKNYSLISYEGNLQMGSALNAQNAAINGVSQSFVVQNMMQIAVRYYNKLDWLFAIIGGTIFLTYAIFYCVFNNYDRAKLKAKFVNELILQKIADPPQNENDVIAVNIPISYMLRRSIPICLNDGYQKLIRESQNEIDIVKTIKKHEVALRNSKKHGIYKQNQQNKKIIQLKQIDELNQKQTSNNLSSVGGSDIQQAIDQSISPPQINNSAAILVQQPNQPRIDNIEQQPSIADQSQQSSNRIPQNFIPIENYHPSQRQSPHNQQPLQNQQRPPHVTLTHEEFQHVISPLHSEIQAQQAQPVPINQKFNLPSSQVEMLRRQSLLHEKFPNNYTLCLISRQKPQTQKQIIQLQNYDKWNNDFTQKPKKTYQICLQYLSKFLMKFDIFSVRIDMIDKTKSRNGCGACLSIIIFILSILTFAQTIGNMQNIQFIISERYLLPEEAKITKKTSDSFNAVTCIAKSQYFQGVSRLATLNLYTVTNGVIQYYQPVQLTASDPVLNLTNNLDFLPATILLTNCYKFPNDVAITINSNSYFGFNLSTYCFNTPSFCNSTQAITNNNYMTAVNNNSILYILPGYRLDEKAYSLVSDLFTIPQVNFDLISKNINMNIQQTAYANKVNLYDDTGNQFMRTAPILIDEGINVGYNTRRTLIKSTVSNSPAYSYKVKLNQASTDYTLTQKKLDWILSVIGGVFVFWYVAIRYIGLLYMRFKFNEYITQLVYEQDCFKSSILKKIIVMLNIPRCLIPRCGDYRRDCDRMKAIQKKIENSLTHLSIVKYTDNLYKFSSSFFKQFEEKNLSLLYLQNKIYLDDMVIPTIVRGFNNSNIPEQDPQQQQLNELEQQLRRENNEFGNQQNQVGNSFLKEQIHKDEVVKDNQIVKQQKQELKRQQYFQYQREKQNIIDPQNTKISDIFDLFSEPSTFTFKGQRFYSSGLGGICCIIMTILMIVVANYAVIAYLSGWGKTISYDIIMDDAPGSSGIQLMTGQNFKIGLSFINPITLQTINVSSFLQTVGVSLLIQSFTRSNGIIIPSITSIDLVPCPNRYLQSWIPSNVDSNYFSGLNNAYCAPDNIKLEISGTPQDSIRKSFKLSIYNKAGNSTGAANITTLLNTSYVMVYFSSPRQNSINRTIEYQIEQILISNFGGNKPLAPFQTNMTLSKSNITYDDNPALFVNPINQMLYRFEPYNQQWLYFEYYGYNSDISFNISFSYTQKVHVYTFKAPKFYEVFGLTGGLIAFFYLLIGCCVKSFNQYKLRYEVTHQLYMFEKRMTITNPDGSIKKFRKSDQDKRKIQKLKTFNEFQILKAYILNGIGWILNNYNFNDDLRYITLLQQKFMDHFQISTYFKTQYKIRDDMNKRLDKQIIYKQAKLLDIYFKKIVNMNPIPYTFHKIVNICKKHNFTSYQQYIIARASQKKIKINSVFDRNILIQQFGIDDGATVRINSINDTANSINSSALNSSIGQRSDFGQNIDNS